MDEEQIAGWFLFALVTVGLALHLWKQWQQTRWLRPGDLPWGMCEECGRHQAIIRCQQHNLRLCWSCLREHDVPTECNYRPVILLREAR